MHADGSDVHAEDGCTASHVEDDFVLEDVLVVVDGVAVGAGADLIFLFHCCQSLSPTAGLAHCGEPTNISSWMPEVARR